MAFGGRFFAGFGAVLFLVTSSALTIAVIMSARSNNNNNSTPSSLAATPNSSSCPNGYDVKVGDTLPGYTPQNSAIAHLEPIDISIGSGATVKSGATVAACYIGALVKTGKVFDTSSAHGGPASFSLSSVITGWQLGIPGMKVGGVRELLIPAAMAYGSQAVSGIPANSDLLFYVSIVSTK